MINLVLLFFIFFYKVSIRKESMCIVVICNDRPSELRSTLTSLIDANGMDDKMLDRVFVSQSGNNQQVASLVDMMGFSDRHFFNVQYDIPVVNRLALHFNWTFSKIFSEQSRCDGLIVIEDDLLLSPDFLEYFRIAVPVLEIDKTLITVSLWNDIGFTFNTNDPHKIKRVSFFPGLGWYLSREIWYNLLGPGWPSQDWDWYVRDRHMDTLVPEIPRDYHNSKRGTYMTTGLFNKYFKDIRLHDDIGFRWKPSDAYNLDFKSYTSVMKNKIKHGVHISDFTQLNEHRINIVWTMGFTEIRDKVLLHRHCGSFYKVTGLWEGEMERGEWMGIHSLWLLNIYKLLIINTNSKWTRPPSSKVFVGLELCQQWVRDSISLGEITGRP